MAKKNAGLGRGLSAILGEVEEAYQNNLNDNSGLVVEIEIDKIKPNPLQPRKVFDNESLQELAASIQEHGLLQPILVYEDVDNSDEYFLIAGERRLRASKIAYKESIKAIIVDVQEEKLRELALIENIQREDLNPIDLAQSYKELIEDYGITHEELAKKLSKSRTQITNTLRLLELDKNVQKYVLENKISQGHAKVLVALPKEQQNIIANSIIGQKLSVHDTENLIRKLKEGQL
ncbi:MAG TPA: ParB/RepB/Spo0J family partition protein, partial [Candidatus Scatomorpha intestinipullorum]|nr:ParB/RepB/Spo0J family partition protein [Candidatus Scatomorpha intestinipullorum]